MVDSKYVLAVSFKLDYSCNSLSFNVDMFASCERIKGIVLMREMMELNLKTNVSGKTWFAKRDLQLAAITMPSGY